MDARRRKILIGAALGLGTALLRPTLGRAQQPGLGRDRLVLLGTKGGPRVTSYAPTPSSNLIVYRNVPYVIDAGYGVTCKRVEAGLKLPALRNVHPPIAESYALKFEFGGKTIVFSGDTTYFPPLAEFAKGADVLVHEVMYGPALEALVQKNPNAATLMAHFKASHTLAEDVGRIAAAAEVKMLVLNHFVPGDDKSVTPEVWTAAVRKTFAGNIVVGRDLLEVAL